ncbi:MAG TPA: hypothetical protein VK002_11505 [Rubricoccaceae bacterium]|nr:hypothetical protein [Rubricoccaceae bacterium]
MKHPLPLRFALPLGVLSVLFLAPTAAAQPGAFGIGGQIGEPTGLTLKFAGRPGVDLAAEWDFDDYFFIQGHVLIAERRFPGASADVRYFYGPGLFIGERNDDTAFGLSFNAGVNYYTGPVEIFGQLTPRLRLTPDSDFDLGAAIGLRFYP